MMTHPRVLRTGFGSDALPLLVAGAVVYSLVVGALYLGGTVVGLTFVVLVSGLALYGVARPLWRQRAIPALALVIAPLTVSWALFGLGGLIATGYPLDDRSSQVGVTYTNAAVLEIALLVLVASIVYALAFKWAAGRAFYAPLGLTNRVQWERWAMVTLVVMLLAIDVYARWAAIEEGAYFAWFGTEDAERYRATSGLQHAQPTLAALLLGMSVYLFRHVKGSTTTASRQRALFALIILFEIVAALMTGSRQVILKTASVFVLAQLAAGLTVDWRRLRRWQLTAAVGSIIFFGWLGPAVQEARFAMDRDRVWMTRSSGELPYLFAVTYLPAAMRPNVVWGPESARQEASNATLLDRLSSYAVLGASVRQRLVDGTPPIGEVAFYRGLSTLLPRMLFPGKADMVGDEVLYLQLGVGRRYLDRTMDAGSTPTVNAYAHLGIPALVAVMALVGAAYGLCTRLSLRYLGVVGMLLGLAFLGSAIPEGDTYMGWMAGARNAFALTGVLLVLRLAFEIVRPVRAAAPNGLNRAKRSAHR